MKTIVPKYGPCEDCSKKNENIFLGLLNEITKEAIRKIDNAGDIDEIIRNHREKGKI